MEKDQVLRKKEEKIQIKPVKKQWALFFILLGFNLTQLILWHVNVYENEIVGAISEILWIFLVLSIIINPILSFVLWSFDKFSFHSKFLYLFIWTVLTLGYMVFVYSFIKDIYLKD